LEEKNPYAGLVIKTGTVCGWCTVNDTLTITGINARYVNYTNCSTGNPIRVKTEQIESSEMDDLLAQLDIDELNKLDLNSCNVCVDGCDDWIFFEKGSESHYIRFGGNEPQLQPIQSFIDKLNAIKTQYSKDK
jgi:hypothetical protein